MSNKTNDKGTRKRNPSPERVNGEGANLVIGNSLFPCYHISRMSKKNSVVVIGGGFGGVYTVKELLKRRIPVTLVSETNFFTFTPLLHEVATGILTSDDITFEYASFFNSPRFSFIRGRAEDIDFDRRVVIVDGTKVSYDDVVIATGSSTNFYGLKGREHTLELKTIEDAAKLKKRMIELGQGVEGEVFVTVIGGGPTGIELVFEMELFLKELKRHNPRLNYQLRVIQLSSAILSPFPEHIQRRAMTLLKLRGIDVLLETTALEVTTDVIKTDQGTFPSNLTVMTAGVTPNVDCVMSASRVVDRGHLQVDESLRVVDREHAFALGDVIAMNGAPTPKLAQTATQQASVIAENIVRSREKRSLVTYVFDVRGMLVSFGYRDGAGLILGLTILGLPAWFLWRTVYLFKTPGLSNKLRVAFSWTIDLFQKRNLAEE